VKTKFAKLVLFAFLVILTFCCTGRAYAQDAASPKLAIFAGPGISLARGNPRNEIQAGLSIEEAPPDSWGGVAFACGYLDPRSQPKAGSAFLSADYMASWAIGPSGKGRTANGKPYWSDRHWKLLPFASTGYTRLFGTGHAINFGGGLDYRVNQNHAIRFEIRDYYAFAQPAQHNVGFRIGWIVYLAD